MQQAVACSMAPSVPPQLRSYGCCCACIACSPLQAFAQLEFHKAELLSGSAEVAPAGVEAAVGTEAGDSPPRPGEQQGGRSFTLFETAQESMGGGQSTAAAAAAGEQEDDDEEDGEARQQWQQAGESPAASGRRVCCVQAQRLQLRSPHVSLSIGGLAFLYIHHVLSL